MQFQLVSQEMAGVTLRTGRYFLWCTTCHQRPAGIATFGTKVYDIVGTLDDIHIVLNDYH